MIKLIVNWLRDRRNDASQLQWARVRHATRADLSYWYNIWKNEENRHGRA